MLAIFKHELRALFHSFTAYVFGAFLLVVVGLGALAYNLQAAVSNFEYVLSFAGIIFVVIVPLLTMRVIAEKRRQKTAICSTRCQSRRRMWCLENTRRCSSFSLCRWQ